MKTIATLLALLVFPAFAAIHASGQEKTLAPDVKVLYFHGTNRCVTCNNMEKYTQELLNEEYSKELKSGRITFEVFDFDNDANAAIVKKYGVESSTLILVQVKQGKEKITDLTDIGFTYAKYQPEKFKEEVQKKLNDKLR
jgi:hypothetical protein